MIPSSEDAAIILTHIVEIGIYALVIFGAILAFRRVFRNKTKPALRFGLWFLLLLRLTVPVTVISGVHLIVLPAPKPGDAPVAAQAGTQNRPVRPAAVTAPPSETGERTEAAAAATEAGTDRPSPIPRLSIWQWLLIAWAAGAVGLLLHRLWLWGSLAARLRAGSKAPDPDLRREWTRLCRRIGILRPVRLLERADIVSPALTIGPRPTVLLPSSLAGEAREQERRFALLHELTHLRRRDHLVMLWFGVLRCVWWFHPVVWLMEKPFRMDMESACDARAVTGMSREEKLAYAALLLELSDKKDL